MKDWVIKSLVEVCELITCGVAARPQYVDEGIPFLSAKNVKAGQVIWNDYKCISEKTHQELTKNNKPLKGDILYTRVGSYGEAAVIEDDYEFSVFVSLTLIKVDKTVLNNYFLKHFLNSDGVKKLAKASISGSGVGNLNVGTVRKFPIPLPPLPEQQRIVSILDQAFAAIDKAKANAERNLKNAAALFESYLQGVFEKKGDGWEEKTLEEIAIVKSGGTPLRHKIEYWSGEIAWYSSGELNNLYTSAPERHINELAIENSNAKLFPKGSLLIGMYDTAALKMSVLDRDAAFNQAIAGVKPNPKIDLIFILHAINAIKPDILNLRRGVRQKNLSLQKIKNISISIPPLKVQQAIVHQFDVLRAEKQKLEALYQKKIADLEELKKSILQKAFAGELTTSSSSAISVAKVAPLQKIEGISATDLQAGITALALQKHIEKNQQHSFHHVKTEKIIHLAEYILNIDLERNPVKDAAGPNDFPHAKKVESRARKAGFYTVYKNGDYYDYQKGSSIGSVIQKTQNCLGEKVNTLSEIIDIFLPMSTQQAEILATIYAAWNNLILKGNPFSDEDIVTEARENWHENKLSIERDKFFNALEWMRKKELLIPKGNGRLVMQKAKKK